jgi:hypothetical protein
VPFAGVASPTGAAGAADMGCSAVSGDTCSSLALSAAMGKDSFMSLEGAMVLSIFVVVRRSLCACKTARLNLNHFEENDKIPARASALRSDL